MQSKAPGRRPKPTKVSDPIVGLEKRKASIYKKIMTNIKQQEEHFSEIRKARIVELEEEYKSIEIEIAKAASLPKSDLPSIAMLSSALPGMTIEDRDFLKLLATTCFDSLYVMKRGSYRACNFEITSIHTAWGDSFKVQGNSRLYFKG